MSFGRNKLLITFAFLGFLLGSVVYFAFDWIALNYSLGPFPILAIISSPWFLSGIAGSLLSVVVLFVSTQVSRDN